MQPSYQMGVHTNLLPPLPFLDVERPVNAGIHLSKAGLLLHCTLHLSPPQGVTKCSCVCSKSAARVEVGVGENIHL